MWIGKVIRRIGRINRIGTKVFGDLYLYNYFPTEQGSDLYNIRTVAKTKVLMIHKAIGEDAQIFSEEESPEASGLFEKLSANPEDAESMTFLTECKVAYAEIRERHPEVIEKISHLPDRVKTATGGERSGTCLFTRKGLTLFSSFMGAEDEKPSYMLMKEAIGYVKCPFEKPRFAEFSIEFLCIARNKCAYLLIRYNCPLTRCACLCYHLSCQREIKRCRYLS